MGALTEIHNFVEAELGLVEATIETGIAADQNGPGVDLLGFRGAEIIAFPLANGAYDPTNYITLELEESPLDSTYTDVAEADMIDPIASTTTGAFVVIDSTGDDSRFYRVGYRGDMRYIRVVANETGTLTGVKIACFILKCGPTTIPTTNP